MGRMAGQAEAPSSEDAMGKETACHELAEQSSIFEGGSQLEALRIEEMMIPSSLCCVLLKMGKTG